MKHLSLYSSINVSISGSEMSGRISFIISAASFDLEKLPGSSEREPAMSLMSGGKLPGKQFTPIPVMSLSIFPSSKSDCASVRIPQIFLSL